MCVYVCMKDHYMPRQGLNVSLLRIYFNCMREAPCIQLLPLCLLYTRPRIPTSTHTNARTRTQQTHLDTLLLSQLLPPILSYTRAHSHSHTHAHTHTHTYTHIHTQAYVHTHTHTHTHISSKMMPHALYATCALPHVFFLVLLPGERLQRRQLVLAVKAGQHHFQHAARQAPQVRRCHVFFYTRIE